MPDTPPVPADPALPPRPSPARTPGEVVAAWLAWFGLSRLVLAAISVAAVAAGAFWLLRVPHPDAAAGLPVATAISAVPTATLPPPTSPAPPLTEPVGPLYVHVAGAVVRPGVYSLPAGARVDAAIGAADGVLPDGDLDALNLAAPLADGQRIYVPVVGEVDPVTVGAGQPSLHGSTGSVAPAGPLDLNTAEVEDLERLPGIGPATAAAIVDDRARNGPFATIDDLERVPGIGPAKLAALRDLVTA